MKLIRYKLKETDTGFVALSSVGIDVQDCRESGGWVYGSVADCVDVNVNGFMVELVNESDFPFTSEEIYQRKVQAGYTINGITLDLSTEARNQFTAQTVLLGLADYTGSVTIADMAGSLKEVSFDEYKQLMLGYGAYYQNIWAASKVRSGSL